MASYLYNPSQKVAELLSQYLEFDAHQLQVGIWSGHLNLKDVHLKASAVDQFLTLPSSSISFQLVSGTIGLLDLQIPWKQLVWGQSDVRVKLQDVVLVLQVKPQDDFGYQQDKPDLSSQYPTDSISRDKKQKRLLEAERRALQGRPLGPWLRSVKKRDEEESAKSQAEEPVMLQQKTWISKRLTSAINDFFWRFFAGLQMQLMNLKIVLVQDGVEVGVFLHSFRVDGKEAVAHSGKLQPFDRAQDYDSGQGEHVNKHVKVSRCGLFIRKEAPRDESDPRGVVLTQEYVLCPLDLDFSFGLFYPYPPGKRQRREITRNDDDTPFHLPENSLQEESSNSSSPKKRRAKREKIIEPQSTSTAALTTDQLSAQQQSLLTDTKPQSYRRSSTTWSKPQTVPRQVTVTLPLAQPKEIKANVTSGATGDHARLEGHLKIRLLQLKFTTRHYHLFGKLMINTIRRRNGRPNETIRGAKLRREQQEEEDESIVAEDTDLVVRSWWIYVITAVLREVRKRRQLREQFQDRFLSFLWDRQKYKRSDYVRLYIDSRLKQHLLARDEEELLRIEDELSIEQILLYRRIARKIHVRGGTKMPSSLLDLGAKDGEISSYNRPPMASNMSTSSAEDHLSVRYTSGPLGRLEEQCERIRLRNDFNDFLFEYRENGRLSALLEEKGVAGEEMSFISAQTSATGGTLEPSIMPVEKSLLLFLSFNAQVDCIEMTVIEEELLAGAEGPRTQSHGSSNGSVGSKITSELSVLTEDELWDHVSHSSCKEVDPFDDSDYVIFGGPEKVLLHTRLHKAKLSVVSGDTGKIVFSIARIVAFGSQDSELLVMGTESLTSHLQQHALLSSVELPRNGVAPTLQVDAATIRVFAQFESLHQLTEFFAKGKNVIPPPLLKASAREEVRLYILKESSHSAWSRVHTSIRIYGTEVILGHGTFRLDMVELYSGNSIPKDCTDDIRQAGQVLEELDSSVPSTRFHTRTLKMIEDGDLAASSSPWCQRWIFALSGADFIVSRQGGKVWKMLESPVDSEALITLNAYSCFDGNRAKVKVLLKISPVCFLLSDERHMLLLSSLPRPLPPKQARKKPPRLEVLSRFVQGAAEVSVQRFQIILCGGKSGTAKVNPDVARRRYLERFLESVSWFDLTFPHEEVLSSAMQICVECLTGTGMPVETAWHAVNAALKHFLEQTTRISEDLDISSDSAIGAESAVRHAADSTLNDFDMLSFVPEEGDRSSQQYVLDLADGFKITTIQLFYDSYVQVIVPSFFCSNGEGVHLVRLSPSVTLLNEYDDDNNRSLPLSSRGSVGLVFTNFLVDKENPFGRGGSPLSVLKSDKDETQGSETQESLSCCRLGELELLYTKKMVQDLYHLVTGLTSSDGGLVMDDGSATRRDSHFCMAVMSASLLLATDDLIPFSRIISSRLHLSSNEGFSLRSEGLNISNLSPGSEVHPVIVSTLAGDGISERKRILPFSLRTSGSHTLVTLSYMQIVLLQKYFEEFRQVMLSPMYGAFPIFQANGGCVDSAASSGSSSLSFRVDLEESSFLLPRSSISADMIAIEIETITICQSNVDSSFSMPDGLSELHLNPVGKNEDGCGVTRTKIEVRGARIFSTLSEVRSDSTGQPAFHHIYEKGGRASPNKNVFVRGTTKNIIGQEEADECNSRLWREMSVIPIAVDVVIDRAPHLRILLTNPGHETGLVSLETRNSQFNLLLSIWYSNMQELPYMFPYPPLDVKAFSELPVKARHFPELGTEEWKNILMNPARLRSEFCLVYDELSLRMSFDCHDDDGRLIGDSPGSTLYIKDAVLQLTIDEAGVARCGVASKVLTLNDENCSYHDFLVVAGDKQPKPWADMLFGLREDYRSLSTKLAQPFQASVFLTPSWSMINVGMDSSRLVLSDFGTVHRLLEFATAFGTNDKHGNPSFEAARVVEDLKKSLMGSSEMSVNLSRPSDVCKGTDFRLWMTSPLISIPCTPSGNLIAQGDGGLWFHSTSTVEFSSQEVVSGGLSLKFQVGINSEQKLIEDLTFGVLVNHKIESNHTDYSIQMPLTDPMACSVVYPRLAVAPTIITDPFVCQPADQPSRHLGPRVCELTCVLEVLPSVASTVLGLFNASEETTTENLPETIGSTFSLVARISDIRFFLLDPILGIHLPIFVLSLSSMKATISQFDAHDRSPKDRSALNELQVIVDGLFWADYFKLGSTRSWEPLLEAFKFCLLWKKSRLRGGGLTLSSDSPLHANISSAFLVIVSQVLELYKQQLRNVLGVTRPPISDTTASMRQETMKACSMLSDVVEGLSVTHRKFNHSDVPERVAFSLKNMTGQRIRFYRYESLREDIGPSPILTYLDHSSVVKLSFEASVSSVQNLVIKEVKYPGFNEASEEVVPHLVDIQLPGCSWIRGLSVDSFGRRFAAIEPKEVALQRRLRDDWRLHNLMQVLVEIDFEKGGRQVVIRSLFEVVNKTSHSIRVICHPNPNASPHFEEIAGENLVNESQLVQPGDAFNVPTLVLLDALNRDSICTGSTGSLWIKPDNVPSGAGSFVETESSEGNIFEVHFSSRAVHLSKLVEESAAIFEKCRGNEVSPDDAKTAVHLACPLVQGGDRIAPFCYAVEVGRSPIVGTAATVDKHRKGLVHGPVLYSLSIHPPFVVVNLLPKIGRFELMHAVHKKVLWFKDVEPGEEVSVHSLGLDSPLMLYINLGFCRTPVGEGALVHHGADHNARLRENLVGLKSIGKAGKAVTKQIGKTLTSIGDSPDKRAQNKIFKAQNPHLKERTSSKQKRVRIGNTNDSQGAADGKTYRVDSSSYSPEDVADGATVVDSLGQKLRLQIENIRGGGGQRRISVYCPFWVVNTTELPLRYKQENSKLFVSGTVHSPNRDGSKLMSNIGYGRSGSNTQSAALTDDIKEKRPLFAGTPGALASISGETGLPKNEIAGLLDAELSLTKLWELAFMFNFPEGLGIAAQRLCIQLKDGTGSLSYQSDWSKGLTLESVGITQFANMHCKDGRFLDVTVVVHLAPGILSSYTRIVRILPRYVFVNMLGCPVRLWQDNSIFHPLSSLSAGAQGETKWRLKQSSSEKNNIYENLWGKEAVLDNDLKGKMPLVTTASQSATYIKTLDSSDLAPFVLPDTRGDRVIRFDFGVSYRLTASVSVDVEGESVLPIKRYVDLKTIRHITTRASPEYQVNLAPNVQGFTGELGVWFESEWGNNRKLIVKGVKKPSFAFYETDIHVGDELLKIDGIPVTRQTFAETMEILRFRLNELRSQDIGRAARRRASLRLGGTMAARESQSLRSTCRPLELVFRTMEESVRRVRMKAAKASAITHASTSLSLAIDSTRNEGTGAIPVTPITYARVELKNTHHMIKAVHFIHGIP
ncbi:hypothetical protein FisN_13Lh037 [Fistulifera solaris]|uniref:PDZ domain-containing protein n=1 Tax=Fistulifera solaris TaxID=1519565 RepID=A0A1Z5JFP8_FISSO|nr:hypothetical protein FisN_13Lh037 [Fistulifera solaris]|eukprot:GAX12581.1 hypothetical protein FisN_13Lh037 [Fistulifera solaris]